jgi:hypothetical protein
MNTPREQLTQESQAERGGRRLAQLTVRAPSGCQPQIRPGEHAPRYRCVRVRMSRPYKLSTPLSAHVRPKECGTPAKRCVRGARAGSRKP